jgi:sigma-B regulation protein RsbU (phosphoserine phosphatase)
VNSADRYQYAPCGLLSTRQDGTLTSVNETLLSWTGHSRDALVGHVRFTDLISPGDRIFYETHYRPLLDLQGFVREIALTLVCPDGRRLPVLVNAAVRDGEIQVAVFAAEDRRRYERELLAARERAEESDARARLLAQTLQASLLPPEPPEIPGMEIAAVYRPAGRGDEVGGDFYDIIEAARDDWTIILGDVCGKGAAAAAITTLVRHTVRAVGLRSRRPHTLLASVNRAVVSAGRRSAGLCFSTAVCARLQLRGAAPRLTISLAGHPHPYLLRDGTSTPLGLRGTMLGIDAGMWLRDAAMELVPGDAVVFYTDGVTEARHDGQFWGDERLRSVITGAAGTDAAGIAGALSDAVLGFQGGDASDDIAIVVLRVPR